MHGILLRSDKAPYVNLFPIDCMRVLLRCARDTPCGLASAYLVHRYCERLLVAWRNRNAALYRRTSLVYTAPHKQKERHHGSHITPPYRSREGQTRSEERRVGKECRSRWSP